MVLNSTVKHYFFRPRIVGDEVFYSVVREKFLELAVELGRQGLIVGDDQRRFIQLLDDVCHREGFPGTGDAQKGLALVALFETFDQFGDRLRLVAGGFVF